MPARVTPPPGRHAHPGRDRLRAALAALVVLIGCLASCGRSDEEPPRSTTPEYTAPSVPETTRAPDSGTPSIPYEGPVPPEPREGDDVLDPRFETCTEANANGYGPYYEGADPEYHWYIDADQDGIDCEFLPGTGPWYSSPGTEPSTPEPSTPGPSTPEPSTPEPSGEPPPSQEPGDEPSAPAPSDEASEPETGPEPPGTGPGSGPASGGSSVPGPD
ncbi:excalibur calcium-binding domain-containing protein [Actinomadura welshii]